MRRLILISCISLSAACSGTQANHLGTPLLWPIMAISSSLDNASYDAKRRKVSEFVRANHSALIAEISNNGGPSLNTAMDLADIPPARRSELLDVLRQDVRMFQDDTEALIVALMVHGN